ncbi:CrcB family protein [Nocardioides sp. CFH 31398]|uniref:fluoride efflux transporter FluC n=1 Tax=Nocardioides sp. CFH 31398 TaxID=2919579 RepID=UPI001F066ABC|nr:CrcB family protein [Nocardioides sp. CFH 31398]MCH1866067.1 CrcB family protein [Nocardioides sp. CFH 31398]
MTPPDVGPPSGPAPWLLLVVVALGGAVGAVGRWAAVGLTPAETGFPVTTFAINLSGSFVLAMLPGLLGALRPRARALAAAALGPGLLGGWTTLSAYAEQSRALLADGRLLLAGAYLAGTLAACLLAVVLGRRLVPAP